MSAAEPIGLMAARLEDLGITYRQFDHWCSKGYVPDLDPHPGHGYPRELRAHQVRHLRIMAGLVRDGMRPDAAARVADSLRRGQPVKVGGYTLDPAEVAS